MRGLQQRVARQTAARRCSRQLVAPRAAAATSVAAPAAAAAAAAAAVQQQADDADQLYPLVDLRQQCKEIRARVCSEWLAGGLIYVAGGDLQHRNGADVYHKFRPASDFAYLTGVSQPGFAALLDPDTSRLTLIAPKVPDDAAVWWGGLPGLDELAEQAGADSCIYASDLPAHLARAAQGGGGTGTPTLHVLPGSDLDSQRALLGLPHVAAHCPSALQQLEGLAAALERAGASTSDAFLQPLLHRCRAVKSDAEVACLLAASRGSAAAHRAQWAAAVPGVMEYQLEAAFVAAAGHAGLSQLGYPCIVGGGRRAAILHYERNSEAVKDGELVLVDAGAEYACYTADITRTFPVNGRFSAAQRDVYDLVLSLQAHALALVAPGAAWADVQASTRRLLLEQLQQLGLVRGSVEALAACKIDQIFMPHGLGHFLGLDVHDVSDVGPVPQVLSEGHVVTVEPGCYFMPLLVQRALADPAQASCLNADAVERLYDLGGVRIEDNVLVKPGGHFNLTMAAGLPKEAADIEAAMAASRR